MLGPFLLFSIFATFSFAILLEKNQLIAFLLSSRCYVDVLDHCLFLMYCWLVCDVCLWQSLAILTFFLNVSEYGYEIHTAGQPTAREEVTQNTNSHKTLIAINVKQPALFSSARWLQSYKRTYILQNKTRNKHRNPTNNGKQ